MTTDILRAFRIDPGDNDSASDNVSRYGAYLRQHHGRFRDGDASPTQDPAEFAAAAFEIAVGPIMSPGYVLTHPRIKGLAVHWDDDGRAAITTTWVSSLPEGLARALDRTWSGWKRDSWAGDRRWSEHHDNDSCVALPTLVTRVPLPVTDLPAPDYGGDVPMLKPAQLAVRTLVAELNTRLAPVLEALEEAGAR